MTLFAKPVRVCAAIATLGVLSLSLGGCGGVDGVQFEGKVFEAVGLSGDAFSKRPEPKTQPRAPLVLPPDTKRLPEPGSAPQTVAADQQWPVDVDAKRAASADALKAAQKKYCEDGNWKDKAHRKEIEAAQGPAGSCHGSAFDILTKGLTGGTSE